MYSPLLAPRRRCIAQQVHAPGQPYLQGLAVFVEIIVPAGILKFDLAWHLVAHTAALVDRQLVRVLGACVLCLYCPTSV